MMKHIVLTQGQVALVDDADFEWLSQTKWCAWRDKARPNGTFYARGTVKGIATSMHREILGLKCGNKLQCDHIDGDSLNNQRSNLRACTGRQNQQNQRPRAGKSQYKGVTFCRRDRKWVAKIRYGGKQVRLGYFNSESDAARSYDKAAMKHFGEFARINFEERRG